MVQDTFPALHPLVVEKVTGAPFSNFFTHLAKFTFWRTNPQGRGPMVVRGEVYVWRGGKTHLPIDALVFSPKAKYLYVGRDARDVAWSFHHHLRNFTPEFGGKIAEIGRRIGSSPPPAMPEDVGEYYRQWLEADPLTENSFWKNVQGWWNVRHLPNVLILHYAKLKADLPGEIRRIANFLDIAIDELKLPAMMRNCSLEHMKAISKQSPLLERAFMGGGKTFINKGTNGRWREVLTPEEIARCDEIAEANLTPDCARWLRSGETPAN